MIYSTEVSGFFISFLISLYSLNTTFTETNSTRVIYESVKAFETRPLIVFNLTALFYHAVHLFLYIDLYFFIPAIIAQIFNYIAELLIP